jgi:hypothetical protein
MIRLDSLYQSKRFTRRRNRVEPEAGIGQAGGPLKDGVRKRIPVAKVTKKPSVKVFFTDGFPDFIKIDDEPPRANNENP